jgi:hypothetical protein
VYVQHNLNVGSVEQPWTKYLETAPEDENTPLPSSFPDYLLFMEMGYKESLKAYLDVLESHVHSKFAQRTKIMELLQTKGIHSTELGGYQGQTPAHRLHRGYASHYETQGSTNQP